MIDGTIVIGEGERDEAPMLYIGEKVGLGAKGAGGRSDLPDVDIAVDPLEGTNLCATGAPNAIAVLAASSKGGLLHAPDLYMEKLVVGPSSKGAVSLDAPVDENLTAIAASLGRDVEDLVVVVLDRPRHEKLIDQIRAAGARIRLICRRRSVGRHRRRRRRNRRSRGDGDRWRAGRRTDRRRDALSERRDLRAPGRQEARARRAQPHDGDHGFPEDLHVEGPGVWRSSIMFAATGVTDGTLMQGVRFFGDGIRTASVVMQSDPARIRFIDTIHVEQSKMVRVRF